VQTFLPYSDFENTVKCLDYRRLGKQRVEAMQILNCLQPGSTSSWKNHPRCKLLVIANQMNIDGVVPGILGLSELVLVTGESISMVSEAASIAKRLVVFLPSKRHNPKIESMLTKLSKREQIVLAENPTLHQAFERAVQKKIVPQGFQDNQRIQEGLRKII